uniref:WGS project CBMI000000000 data, contig CS3069_c002045 n=1 Tax=Fusarium clavum TaxID=2594811 RepID=A0A090MCE6_9HYPO|nr:unnamed protein product [Fusarium clavum]
MSTLNLLFDRLLLPLLPRSSISWLYSGSASGDDSDHRYKAPPRPLLPSERRQEWKPSTWYSGRKEVTHPFCLTSISTLMIDYVWPGGATPWPRQPVEDEAIGRPSKRAPVCCVSSKTRRTPAARVPLAGHLSLVSNFSSMTTLHERYSERASLIIMTCIFPFLGPDNQMIRSVENAENGALHPNCWTAFQAVMECDFQRWLVLDAPVGWDNKSRSTHGRRWRTAQIPKAENPGEFCGEIREDGSGRYTMKLWDGEPIYSMSYRSFQEPCKHDRGTRLAQTTSRK